MSETTSPRVRHTHRIAEVDAAAWDGLAADDVYAQHGWLCTLEETVTNATDPVYFLVEENGALLGAAICYRLGRASHSLLDELFFGRLRKTIGRFGLSLHPVLVCGPLIGQGRHILWTRGDPAAGEVIRELLRAIARYADAEQLNVAVAKLPVEEQELLRGLAGGGYARTMNWPVNYMDVRWDSFDAYVAGLGAKRTTSARRECAAPAATGIEISQELRFGDHADRLYSLIEANQQAHSDEPLGVESTFFTTLARRHADRSVVTVARGGTTIVATALLLVAGRCAGGPFIGLSADNRNRKAFTYFNMALYEPVRWCIEHGVKRLYLGAGLYDMKRRRGCDHLELAMLVRHRNWPGRLACRLLCRVHRFWVRTKLVREGIMVAPTPVRR